MSGLSAKTNSCGGDGVRFLRGGGDGFLGSLACCLKKNSRLPFFGASEISISPSSEESDEEISERPEEDISTRVSCFEISGCFKCRISQTKEENRFTEIN